MQLIWSQKGDDCGLKRLVLWVATDIEYRARIISGNEIINAGDTINKTELCRRYGILTRNGKPDYKEMQLIGRKLLVKNGLTTVGRQSSRN